MGNCVVFKEKNDYYITSPYGKRIHPITKVEQFHSGVDIVRLLPDGSHDTATIVAIESAIVRNVGYDNSNGYYVDLLHTSGRRTMYLHLAENSIPSAIVEGAVVKKGYKIGYMGSTGSSTAAHLHFQVYDVDGKTIIDPVQFLEGRNINEVENEDGMYIKVEACKEGSRGTKVINLQKKICQLSEEYEKEVKAHSYQNGAFDGVYGVGLVATVKKIQKEIGLTQTGAVDETLAKYLNSCPVENLGLINQIKKVFD